jgi:hypothetical protein
MENHPIPQDVTGFQFKLIGNMTVKQFAYVAVGVVLSVIFYYAPLLFVIKIPFIILFSSVGVALAFLPLDGRPLDVMLSQFLRALFLPNQYIYAKEGIDLSFSFPIHTVSNSTKVTPKANDIRRKKALAHLLAQKSHTKSHLDEKENSFLSDLFSNKSQPAAHQPTVQDLASSSGHAGGADISGPSVVIPITPIAYPDEKKSDSEQKLDHDPEKIEEILKEEAVKAKKALEEAELEETAADATPQATDEAHERFLVLQKQLAEITNQQKVVEEEIKRMQAERTTLPPQETYTPQADTEINEEHVKKISPLQAKAKGILHAPDTPNVIVGIVQDPRGNMLSHILVEIRDQDGSPVRAFKTNELGQFATATPLSNGTYTMVFEDPQGKQQFDTIELVCTGQLLPPMEVVSHDEREELRRALFS